MSLFSETLVRLRSEAGFRSSYAFFHDNGGAAVLKMSFVNYTSIERGKSLPNLEKLLPIIFALRLVPKSRQAFGLTSAWMRTAYGEDVYRDLVGPFMTEPPPSPEGSPLVQTIKKSLSDKSVYVSPEQFRAIVKDRSSFICYLALSTDEGIWSAEKLAGELKLGVKAVAASLKELKSAGILKEMRPGSYRCLWADSLVHFPSANNMDELYDKFVALQDELVNAGKPVYTQKAVFRADLDKFHNFFPLIALYMQSARVYATTKKSANSALVFVEGRVRKLKKF